MSAPTRRDRRAPGAFLRPRAPRWRRPAVRRLLPLLALALPATAAADEAPHWAFPPPRRPEAPTVKDAAWVRNPIDSFILARLEKAGLPPAPAADRLTLLRRVTFDLTGLPPTPREIDDFLADTSP